MDMQRPAAPDVQLWAVLHAITVVDLSTRTRGIVTSRKWSQTHYVLGNCFEVVPTELFNGAYQLPLLMHYNKALEHE